MEEFYRPSRRSHSSFFSLAGLLGQSRVAANADGTIQVDSLTGLSGTPQRWREVDSFIWEDGNGEQLVATTRDGRVENFAAGSFGAAQIMQRVPGWASAS